MIIPNCDVKVRKVWTNKYTILFHADSCDIKATILITHTLHTHTHTILSRQNNIGNKNMILPRDYNKDGKAVCYTIILPVTIIIIYLNLQCFSFDFLIRLRYTKYVD